VNQQDPLRLAGVRLLAPISVIVPTYNEAENIPELAQRLQALRNDHDVDLELLIMDDDSPDDTRGVVSRLDLDWVRLVVRTSDRGLSQAVVEGLNAARHPVLVVMDADLSHPPEKIPDMILALESGQQFVIGSRYVAGGRTDGEWGFMRWLNSRIATLLARPFSSARDPMSGFFALRRSDFIRADRLNPLGYKIGLELIVKCGLENVGEVPIYFADRKRGKSKLDFRQQLLYLMHLRRLLIYQYSALSQVFQFALVGASGAVVNLVVLTLLSRLGAPVRLAILGGIAVSIVTNFALNRRLTFSYARDQSVLPQFMGFVLASSLGAAVNFAVADGLLRFRPDMSVHLAAMAGIASGMFLNFVANRYAVFRKKRS
jgi:dolichol-phosphate mannosyltransferase